MKSLIVVSPQCSFRLYCILLVAVITYQGEGWKISEVDVSSYCKSLYGSISAGVLHSVDDAPGMIGKVCFRSTV